MGSESDAAQTPDKGEPQKPTQQERPSQEQKDKGAKPDPGSHRKTQQPWKGNPEKEQRNDGAKIDLEKWHDSGTH